jgi:hypothetical protein
MGSNRTLRRITEELERREHEEGLASLFRGTSGGFAEFRRFELAAAMNRLRSLRVEFGR